MVAGVRVQLNHRGMAELLHSPGIVADLEARGQRVESAARDSAPVDSGEYRNLVKATTEDHGDRVVVHVGVDLPYAMRVEANHGTLARALDAAGG